MDSIEVKTLEVNLSSLEQEDLERVRREHATRNWAESPYPCDSDLNQRIVLYDGDIELLRAEAIVNPTNEHLTKMDYVTKLAGPELESFVRKKLRNCPTGEVCLSPGFASNYKFIIHAVPPKYKSKYKTAAETALFHTYFRILETMMERKIRTCVIPILATNKSNLPLGDHCHIQLRTLRRILEKKRHEFDRIVLHISQPDAKRTYPLPFRCYFPRTRLDEEIACYMIEPDSLGGPNGEPVIPERQIRIKSKPSSDQNSIDLKTGLDLSTVVGMTPFSKMRELTPNGSLTTAATRSLVPARRQYCTIC